MKRDVTSLQHMTDGNRHNREAKNAADLIVGTWSPQWSIGDGEPTPAEDLNDITLTFADGRCEVRRGRKMIRFGTYSADATTSPATLDVCFTESDVPS